MSHSNMLIQVKKKKVSWLFKLVDIFCYLEPMLLNVQKIKIKRSELKYFFLLLLGAIYYQWMW